MMAIGGFMTKSYFGQKFLLKTSSFHLDCCGWHAGVRRGERLGVMGVWLVNKVLNRVSPPDPVTDQTGMVRQTIPSLSCHPSIVKVMEEVLLRCSSLTLKSTRALWKRALSGGGLTAVPSREVLGSGRNKKMQEEETSVSLRMFSFRWLNHLFVLASLALESARLPVSPGKKRKRKKKNEKNQGQFLSARSQHPNR